MYTPVQAHFMIMLLFAESPQSKPDMEPTDSDGTSIDTKELPVELAAQPPIETFVIWPDPEISETPIVIEALVRLS